MAIPGSRIQPPEHALIKRENKKVVGSTRKKGVMSKGSEERAGSLLSIGVFFFFSGSLIVKSPYQICLYTFWTNSKASFYACRHYFNVILLFFAVEILVLLPSFVGMFVAGHANVF